MTVINAPGASRRPASSTPPTRLSACAFAFKAAALTARRAAADVFSRPPRLVRAAAEGFETEAGRSRTALWTDGLSAERSMQFGKVENLRRACRALDGLIIPAGAVFSFWRQVGRPVRGRGFVTGRMLKEGCLVPAVGGGLCQISNALYDVALQAGCRIVERHPHSRIVPGSAGARDRDATVAWNYVDLRFTSQADLRLTTRLGRDDLEVTLLTRERPASSARRRRAPVDIDPELLSARSCASCDEVDCFRHEAGGGSPAGEAGPHVFLVDEAWPEFRAYVRARHGRRDRLGLPLAGRRLGLARYGWDTDGFAKTGTAPLAALGRTWSLRTAPVQGPLRRTAEMDGARALAASLARLLTPEVTAVTVAQSYLPFMSRAGVLGGRRVAVLMTRLPMGVLQSRLDDTARAHPDRRTLSDFRAPAWLVEAEALALSEAERIVTPHAEIASLFGARAVRLAWSSPARLRPPGPASLGGPVRRIAFPGPTVARKGAFAVREVARALDLQVVAMGAQLEGPDFWHGVQISSATDWDGVDAVVQPAIVEDQPRRLLAALSSGVPVVATAACGLDPQPGLTLIPPDDPQALYAALERLGGKGANSVRRALI